MKYFPRDILSCIMNYCRDPSDWINLMLVCRRLRRKILPIFSFTKFKFIKFYHQEIPLCVRNNPRVKRFQCGKYQLHDLYYLSTNERLVYDHFQFCKFYLYKTYGIFLSSLYVDRSGVNINYENVLQIISDNPSLIKRFKSITKLKHIKYVSGYKSYKITKESIKNYQEHYPDINNSFSRINPARFIKLDINECTLCVQSLVRRSEDYCRFCGSKYSDDEYAHHRNDSMRHFIGDDSEY